MGIFHKPPRAPQLASQKGSPRMGSIEPISTPHGVFPSQGDPELRSTQLQSTTETTPCPAALHTLHTLHHSASHPLEGALYRWRYQCMGARATTSDQPIAPSPNEPNIKPPTLIPLQSFFPFLSLSRPSTTPNCAPGRQSKITFLAVSGHGASSLVDRAYQSAMTVSCVSSCPRRPTGCKASKPRGQPLCHSARP